MLLIFSDSPNSSFFYSFFAKEKKLEKKNECPLEPFPILFFYYMDIVPRSQEKNALLLQIG
jgi:hypothetical protein